jgi:hypothetical protein
MVSSNDCEVKMITILIIMTTLLTCSGQQKERNKGYLAHDVIENFVRLEFNFRDEEL